MIDVASRYKAARPLKTKQASEVAKALAKIYPGKLKFPKNINGRTRKAIFGWNEKNLSANGTPFRTGRVDVHKDQAIIERFNKTFAARLFSHQYGMGW